MKAQTKKAEPTGRKIYTDPTTGTQRKGAVVPLAKIRADEIWAQVRQYIDQHEIFGNRLLVACYIQPEQRESGLWVPGTVREEDVWQGVTGLVLQVGPAAFIDTDKWKFGGQRADVGDWVTFQPANTILQKFGGEQGRECRIIQDCYLIGRVGGPHVVF